MYDIKFEESGLLAEFFGFGKVQLESSTKYICKFFCNRLIQLCCRIGTFGNSLHFCELFFHVLCS